LLALIEPARKKRSLTPPQTLALLRQSLLTTFSTSR
jgi:hypothetical protein